MATSCTPPSGAPFAPSARPASSVAPVARSRTNSFTPPAGVPRFCAWLVNATREPSEEIDAANES